MSKFKKGDRVKIINKYSAYFNQKATITEIDNSPIPYFCAIDNDDYYKSQWCQEKDLVLLKNSEKCFTISVRKHKRINLKFTV